MAKTKLVSPNVNTRTLPQTRTHRRPHRTFHLPLSLCHSLALLFFSLFYFSLTKNKNLRRSEKTSGNTNKKAEKTLYGKQLLANRIE